MDTIINIFQNMWKYITLAGPLDLVDIIIMAFLFYKILILVRKSNAMKVLRGILAVILIMWLSEYFKLYMLNFMLTNLVQVGLLALVVVFQPELRKILEQMGGSSIRRLIGREMVSAWETAILQTTEACKDLAWAREGALIVFERHIKLDDYIKTGTIINSDITTELLKNIFYPKAPMHDGAVVIQNARVAGAGCMLPLTNNQNLSRDLGMRHRAGIGMSENSDAVVVIVSEETGSISVAIDGMLKRHLTPETLEKVLLNELIPVENDQPKQNLWQRVVTFFRGKNNED